MCTAVEYRKNKIYFGRNLDYDFSYGEEVVIIPRNYKFNFKNLGKIENHFGIIGTALVVNNYPLLFDGMNEKGLAVAGLNFVGNAKYFEVKENKTNIAQYEFILYLLTKYQSVDEILKNIDNLNITNQPFNEKFPPSQLHYMISDKEKCIVLEPLESGIKVYENKVGVLTNNPPFEFQLFNLNKYMKLSEKDPTNEFSKDIDLKTYSRGMGAIGLPGDLSSSSRFVKVAFTKLHSLSQSTEESEVNQFFHILNLVEQQRGCCEVKENEYEITLYSNCYDLIDLNYFYKTYTNNQLSCIKMKNVDLNSDKLFRYKMLTKENINYQN